MEKLKSLTGFKEKFNEGIESGKEFVSVHIENKDMNGSEIIINSNKNFEYKLKYYLNSYNEDLTLKAYNRIKITGIEFNHIDNSDF